MSATSPCVPCCADTQTVNIPGAEGEPGADGANGVNAFTTTSAPGFTVPNVGAPVTVPVGDSSWMAVDQELIVEGPVHMRVSSKPTTTSVILVNLGEPGDLPPTSAIPADAIVSPS